MKQNDDNEMRFCGHFFIFVEIFDFFFFSEVWMMFAMDAVIAMAVSHLIISRPTLPRPINFFDL